VKVLLSSLIKRIVDWGSWRTTDGYLACHTSKLKSTSIATKFSLRRKLSSLGGLHSPENFN